MTPWRSRSIFSEEVLMTMPSATGVVQDEGVPLRPSISTTHKRHEPNAFSRSVAQSFGISIPTSAAARMIEVSAGTSTLLPSIVTVTFSGRSEAGVPKSGSIIKLIAYLHRSLQGNY